jgi:hypothetical protein
LEDIVNRVPDHNTNESLLTKTTVAAAEAAAAAADNEL